MLTVEAAPRKSRDPRAEAAEDLDSLVLGRADAERLTRAQSALQQLALLIGECRSVSVMDCGQMADLLLVVHAEMAGAVERAIPPQRTRH